MSVYTIFRGITAVQTSALAAGNQVVKPESSGNPNKPAQAHSFILTVTGPVAGAATVQPVGSHDGVNFVNYGPTFSVTVTGATDAVGAQSGIIPFEYVGGYVTAISGTGTAAKLTLSA